MCEAVQIICTSPYTSSMSAGSSSSLNAINMLSIKLSSHNACSIMMLLINCSTYACYLTPLSYFNDILFIPFPLSLDAQSSKDQSIFFTGFKKPKTLVSL